MSYQENDSSRHDDDLEQENSEGASAEQLQEEEQQLQQEQQQEPLQQLLEPSATPSEPHKRNCPEGYTFCFTLWSQTSNGTKLVKQGKQRSGTASSPTNSSLSPTLSQVAGKTTQIPIRLAVNPRAPVQRPHPVRIITIAAAPVTCAMPR